MASSEAIGKIVSQIGGVNASGPDGQSRPLEAGDEVFANEVINTGSDGVVIVEFSDGSRKGMGSDNSISLDKEVFDPDAPPPSEVVAEVSTTSAPETTGAPEVVGSLSSASGTVTARGADGAERQLEAGDQIYSNETVITGDNSLAIFEFSDGSRKGLTSNIELSMDESVYRSGAESVADGAVVADAGAAELGGVIGTVNSLQGSLTAVAPDGSERTLDVGDEVFSGERLTTANDSAGIVELADGSMRGFSGGSDITLSESMMQPVQAATETQLADAGPTELGGVIGSVNSLQGSLTAVAPDGSERTLDVGDEVFSGERLTTANDSAGIVELADGSMRGFSGGSDITLSESMMQPVQAATETQLADAGPTELGGVIGSVNSLQGSLTAVAPDGSERTLDTGDEVFAGETISTGNDSAGIIELADGSMRGVAGGSDLTLSDSMLRGAEGSETGTQLAEGPAMTVGDVAGSMTSTSGTVTAVAPDGSERELGEGDEFFGGETLVVADGGAAIVEMADGGVKGLSSGTELTLDGAVPMPVEPAAPVAETLLADAGDTVDAALEPITEPVAAGLDEAPVETTVAEVVEEVAPAVIEAAPEVIEVAETVVEQVEETVAEVVEEPVVSGADVQSVLAAAQDAAAYEPAESARDIAESAEPMVEIAAAELTEAAPVEAVVELAAAPAAMATVSSVGGEVTVTSADGTERSVDSGDEIFAGETVAAADGSTAIIAMSDGSVKGISGGSELTLDESMLRPAETTAETTLADAGSAAELGDVMGSVNTLQGTVTAVAPNGSERTLDTGDEVFSGETIVTADGSTGILELSDGSMRGLSAGSEVALEEGMLRSADPVAETTVADAGAVTELGDVIGSVNSLQGGMTATAPDGSARTLDVGDEVFAGETVTLADASAGIVELSDGSFRGFSGGSEVTLSESMMQPEAAAETQLADAGPTELGGVIGNVNSLEGSLSATAPDGSERELSGGDEVFAGETLQMADGSTGIIELADGSMRGMSGGSELELSDSMVGGGQPGAETQLAEGPAMTVGDAVGGVSSVAGSAKAVAPDGSERELAEGDEMFGGETIVVADGSAAIVEFLDGSVKGLSSGSEMMLEGGVPIEAEPLQAEEPMAAETLMAEAETSTEQSAEEMAIAEEAGPAADAEVETVVADAEPVVEDAAPEMDMAMEAAPVEPASTIEVAGVTPTNVPGNLMGGETEPAVIKLSSHNVKVHVEEVLKGDTHEVEIQNFDVASDTLVLNDILVAEGWDENGGKASLRNYMQVSYENGDTIIEVGRWVGDEFVVDNKIVLDGVNLADYAAPRGAVDQVASLMEDPDARGEMLGSENMVGAPGGTENEGADGGVWVARSDQSTTPDIVKTGQPMWLDSGSNGRDAGDGAGSGFDTDALGAYNFGDGLAPDMLPATAAGGPGVVAQSAINLLDSVTNLLTNLVTSLLDDTEVGELADDLLALLNQFTQDQDIEALLGNIQTLLTAQTPETLAALPADLQSILGVAADGTLGEEGVLENVATLVGGAGDALANGEDSVVAETLDVLTILADGLSNQDPGAVGEEVSNLGDIVQSLGGLVDSVAVATADSDNGEMTGESDSNVLATSAGLLADVAEAAAGGTLLSTDTVNNVFTGLMAATEDVENLAADALFGTADTVDQAGQAVDTAGTGVSNQDATAFQEAFAELQGAVGTLGDTLIMGGDGSTVDNTAGDTI